MSWHGNQHLPIAEWAQIKFSARTVKVHSLTWDVNPKAIQARDGDDFSAIDCSVKGIHCEGRRTVHNTVSRIQTTPHEQVYQLICPTSHLQQVMQLGLLKLSKNLCALPYEESDQLEAHAMYQEVLHGNIVEICQGSPQPSGLGIRIDVREWHRPESLQHLWRWAIGVFVGIQLHDIRGIAAKALR